MIRTTKCRQRIRASMVRAFTAMPDSIERPLTTALAATARANTKAGVAFYWPRRDLAILFAITIVGTALRLFRIEWWSLSATEAATWRAVTQPLTSVRGLFASEQGLYPLAFLGQRWLFDIGLLPSPGEGWWRVPYVFFGMLTVPLLALVGRRLVGSAAALIASGLLALHPWHIEASQTAAPAVVAVWFGVLAAAAAVRVRVSKTTAWWVSCACLVVMAGACHPSGWSVGLGLGVVWIVARWPNLSRRDRYVALAAATVAAALVVWFLARFVSTVADETSWLTALGLPTVVLAAFGAMLAPRAIGVAAVVPIMVVLVARLGVGPVPVDCLLVALPAWILLAAVAGQHWFQAVQGSLTGAVRGVRLVACFAVFGLGSTLAIDTFLQATIYQGQRAPWRKAAQSALGLVGMRPGLRVGAGVGADSLMCYLRPNQWRESVRDPHPGIEVHHLDLSHPDVALDVLVENGDLLPTVLVLRQDELTALEASPARVRLRQSFVCERVLPCQRPLGDETISVFRQVEGR
ncbi:MAG: hypothetical protein ABIP94_09175 [Planctomycetota bacterium]